MIDSQLINQFLIAMPALDDPNFAHSVTYLFQHNQEGAVGIVVNRPLQMQLGDVLDHLEIQVKTKKVAQLPVLMGGPVQRDRGFIFHHPIGNWQSTLHVNDAFGITTSKDILEAIAQDCGPEKVLVVLGYAGWGPGQLEHELSENAWLSVASNADIIFHTPIEKRWEKATALLGINLNHLSNQAGHA